ncbi:unnamed protein product [[Candida] boidinii]|uniref:Unnamed protein product n=1 Tax=Candida boidinii TaxID=5477 RepID=A0A9W6WLH7_CANBO|nr:unnamed protein product [[Candida] boidinii]
MFHEHEYLVEFVFEKFVIDELVFLDFDEISELSDCDFKMVSMDKGFSLFDFVFVFVFVFVVDEVTFELADGKVGVDADEGNGMILFDCDDDFFCCWIYGEEDDIEDFLGFILLLSVTELFQ